MTLRGFFFFLTALLFVVGVIPLGLLLKDAFGKNGVFTLHILTDPTLLTGLFNSFKLAFVVASATTMLGVIAGYLFARTNLGFSGLWMLLLTIPLLIPPYILAYAWTLLAGHILFGFWGTALVLFSIYLPLVMWIVYFYMRRFDPLYEEAGLLVARQREVFLYITLPMLKPALWFAFLLIFLLTFGDYAVSNMLHYTLFSTQIYTYFTAFYDFNSATVAAIPLFPIVLSVVILQRMLKKIVQRQSDVIQAHRMQLSKSLKIIVSLLIALLIIILVVLPLGVLITEVESPKYFFDALHQGILPLGRSVVYASMAALFLTLFGFLCAVGITQKEIFVGAFCDAVLLFWFALPAVVLGVAFILFWNRPMPIDLYMTFVPLMIAWVVKYLALTTKTIQAKLIQIPESLFEAAELAGANWVQRIRWITFPLTKDVVMLAFVVGFLFVFRETALTMLLHPPGNTTLPVYILTQTANGKPQIIAALSLMAIIVTLTVFLFGVGRFYHRKRNR